MKISEILGLKKKEFEDFEDNIKRDQKRGYNQAISEIEKWEISQGNFYNLMMNEFAKARDKGLTNLYIHGDAVDYVAKSILSQTKTWIVKKEPK